MKKLFSQSGQGLVEYALILVLVSVVVIAALMIIRPAVEQALGGANQEILKNAPVNTPVHLDNIEGGYATYVDYDDGDCLQVNVGANRSIKVGTTYDNPKVITINHDDGRYTICNNARGTILKIYWASVEPPK